MANGYQVVGIGTVPNDSQGDNLRVGFSKINTNFSGIFEPVVSAVSPNGVVTPAFTGQNVLQFPGNLWFQSVSLNPTGWVCINYPYTFSGLYSYQRGTACPSDGTIPSYIGVEYLQQSSGNLWWKAFAVSVTGWSRLSA